MNDIYSKLGCLQVKTLLSFVRQKFDANDLRNALESARSTLDSENIIESGE